MIITPWDAETRRGIFAEISRMFGLDGQAASEDWLRRNKVEEIELRRVDDGDREETITVFTSNDFDQQGIDGLMRMLESASTRDALTRYGTILYKIYFHLTEQRKNRGQHAFYLPGGASQMQGPKNGLSRGRGLPGGFGSDVEQQLTLAEWMKIVPELLRWSTEERRTNDERTARIFTNMEHIIDKQNEQLQRHSDRELRILEMENSLNEKKYELDLRKKADESKEEWGKMALDAVKTQGPKLLPHVIEAIKKFNYGPDYVPPPPAAPPAAQNGNGAAHRGASELDILHGQIALDLVRLIATAKIQNALPKMREVLAENKDLLELFDAIVQLTETPDAAKPENIMTLVQMALGFGGALKESPMLAMKLLNATDGFVKASLVSFAKLLEHYVEYVESRGGGEPDEPADAPKSPAPAPEQAKEPT